MGNMLLLVLISAQGPVLYLASFSHTLITTAIMVTFIYHRDRIERKRQAALQASESNYRLLLEQASDGIFITDPQGNYVMVNSKGREMLGASTGELLRRNIRDCLLSADLTRTPLHWDDLSAGKTVIAECDLRSQNARLIPVEVSIKRLDDDRLQAIVRDFTERKRAEERLRYQAHLLANINDVVVATDEHLSITAWNRAAEKLYGRQAEEVLGRKLLEVIPSELTDTQRAEQLRILAKTGHHRLELVQYRKDGQPIYIETSTIALYGADGSITGYVAVNRDITERKQAEARFATSFMPVPQRLS